PGVIVGRLRHARLARGQAAVPACLVLCRVAALGAGFLVERPAGHVIHATAGLGGDIALDGMARRAAPRGVGRHTGPLARGGRGDAQERNEPETNTAQPRFPLTSTFTAVAAATVR